MRKTFTIRQFYLFIFSIFRMFLFFVDFHDLFIFIYYIHLYRPVQYLRFKTLHLMIACLIRSLGPKTLPMVAFLKKTHKFLHLLRISYVWMI